MRNVRRSGSLTLSICAASFAFTSGRAKYPESSFQSETLAGLARSKIFPGHHTLHDEFRFLLQCELGRSPALHETREHFLQQRPTGPELFVETVLDETGDGIVKTMRQNQRRSALAAWRAITISNRFQKFFGRLRSRRFCKSGGHKLPSVVVGAAHQDFSPWLRVRRRHTVTICQHVDLLWRQLLEKSPRQLAQKRVAQTVDALEMFEQKNQLLEVHCLEFAVHAV